MESFFARLPLAGVSSYGYDTGARGRRAKLAVSATRLALMALSLLAISGAYSSPALPATFGCVAVGSFALFTFGSGPKRSSSELFFEWAVASVCVTLSILLSLGVMSPMQAGLGILGTVGGSLLLGNGFERGILLAEYDGEAAACPIDYPIGLQRDLVFTLKTFWSRITHASHYRSAVASGPNDTALVCLFHGLNGHPSIFDGAYDLAATIEGASIFQPHILKRGNCTLDEATEPLYTEVLAWAKAHPEKPIVLCGVSNGGRIACNLYAKLRTEGDTLNPVHIFSIAAPLLGTKMMDQPDWPKWLRTPWSWLVHKMHSAEPVEELAWRSLRSDELVTKMKRMGGGLGVSYHFYATTADTKIVPYRSALPSIEGATYRVVHAEGHSSVVAAILPEIWQEIQKIHQPAV